MQRSNLTSQAWSEIERFRAELGQAGKLRKVLTKGAGTKEALVTALDLPAYQALTNWHEKLLIQDAGIQPPSGGYPAGAGPLLAEPATPSAIPTAEGGPTGSDRGSESAGGTGIGPSSSGASSGGGPLGQAPQSGQGGVSTPSTGAPGSGSSSSTNNVQPTKSGFQPAIGSGPSGSTNLVPKPRPMLITTPGGPAHHSSFPSKLDPPPKKRYPARAISGN